ncbi:tRNA wybutosine-synthesizing protein 3 [Escovopsis weberi]|uniref:tRNA(Phe) 7-[(3-amino-3-carboxypropyl)-4-demethylwyosine(37)-N(4)]-methyltransferase n=1 Tax=Escovopsis weberi TaxID=150374 RepID=A0A0M8N693_ESCWE|nr:tRNA wybutosine-synthesizing protein 3 [Escovopsis weberi]
MAALAPPQLAFAAKKSRILQLLAVPDAEYTDASPKGSVDAAIRHLIDEVNAVDGLVTTSSCAGRVSIFLEGRRTRAVGPAEGEQARDVNSSSLGPESGEQVAGVGGKGAGGTWLYVSHELDPSLDEDHVGWLRSLGLLEAADPEEMLSPDPERRLIHLKFEPMILHVLTASPAHAQLLLRCALQAGFRESGAVSITPPSSNNSSSSSSEQHPAMPMVAVRSMGLGLESLVGYAPGPDAARRRRTVSPEYLRMLLRVCNERFAENAKRIERFRDAFGREVRAAAAGGHGAKMSPEGGRWEDPAERRERKRAEGLRRRAALQAEQAEQAASSSQSQDSCR